MAVEARGLPLFPSQMMPNREILTNPIGDSNANIYSNQAGTGIGIGIGIGFGGVTPVSGTTVRAATNTSLYDALVPFYNSSVGGGALPPTAKTTPQPGLKDDSNSILLHPTRKRRRDLSMPCVINNTQFLSAPTASTGNLASGVEDTTSGVSNGNGSSFSFFGEDLSLQVMQQQLELDRLISSHMENVRMGLEDRRRTHLRRIIAAMQEASLKRLRDKEVELQKIGKLNQALEDKVKSLCVENQLWRNLAQNNEATANALRNNLQQVLAQNRNAAEDEHSCCGSTEEDPEEVEQFRWRKIAGASVSGDASKCCDLNGKCGASERVKIGNFHCAVNGNCERLCKKCGRMESCVLLLPCRHLCLCAVCGPSTDACPVCNSLKNASVHVNLS